MPIYEYICAKCGTNFELLVREGTKLACPECGAAKVEKQFSAFAAHEGGKSGPPPCQGSGPGCNPGRCGSGMCGLE